MLPRSTAFFVLAVGPCMAMAAISACSSEDGALRTDVNNDVDAAMVSDDICPATAPPAGEACAPEGTACTFSGSCGPFAQCLRGTWVYGAVPSPPPCPDTPPAIDSACPSCWPETVVCRYGSDDCSLPDASAKQTSASCSGGKWLLGFAPCADASTDVQGDGGADRD